MKLDVPVTVLIADGASVAEVEVKTPWFNWTGIGEAKVHPRDEPNDEVAFTLSLARALEALAEKLHGHAYDIIDNELYKFPYNEFSKYPYSNSNQEAVSSGRS